jgi:C-terminal processing protease CtpA/Prc
MGLFISRRMPYQRHVVEERDTDTVRDWVEYATPRLTKPVSARLVVLVNRWTGSMGEGIAIGFDAMKRATVVGTAMAGLRGAVDSTTLPVSGLRVFFPTERLFHVNGTPRHEWLPPARVTPGPGDPWMTAAEKVLNIR